MKLLSLAPRFVAAIALWTITASLFEVTEVPIVNAANCGNNFSPNQHIDSSERIFLPIVFHLHRSPRWTTPESLYGVLAETQRIFDRANIAIQPMFDANDSGTEFLDVYFTPVVNIRGQSVNGVSFSRGAREVFVRDDVTLRKVADCRPLKPLQAPELNDSVRSENARSARVPLIRVSSEEAEQARTLAHEISHQLGLAHRQDETSLQASGTTGWGLNESEIATMRQIAVLRFGAIAR